MNVDIRDHKVFDSLDPLVVIRHIVANGWQEKNRIPGEMAVYELKQNGSEPCRVWVPLSRDFSDYASVMSNAFKTLAQAEKKTQLSLLDDLQTNAIGDVIRVGSENRLDKSDHTLLFNEGVLLHEQAREMILAGAWNASIGETKKPVYPQSTRIEIFKYMQGLRLAQTERGSFIVRLISPINQSTLNQLPLSMNIPIEIPFERQALVELLRGLKALKQVAQDVNKRGKFYFPAFEEVVQEGVSANLCDAIAPMSSKVMGHWNPVRVNITWCNILPLPHLLNYTDVEFEPDLMYYIQEASKEFKKRNPVEVILKGAVTDLHRSSKEVAGAGEVRVYGVINERPRYVKIILNQQDYELALDAHKSYREVSVTGNLLHKNNVYSLDKPTNFHIVDKGTDIA